MYILKYFIYKLPKFAHYWNKYTIYLDESSIVKNRRLFEVLKKLHFLKFYT